ncbi:26857_t:CDS:2, partial [Racocetra persica]
FISNKRPRMEIENHSPPSPPPINYNEMPISTFCGTLENTIKCLSCGNQSRTKEDFHDLTLSLKVENESDKLSLDDMLFEFFTPEELNEDNQYYCDKCTGLQDAIKTTRIIVPPRYLILSLNRFEYDTRYARRIKIMTPVTLQDTLFLNIQDTLSLNLQDALSLNGNGINPFDTNGYDKDSNVEYDLSAMVVHSGTSAEYGHYYTYAKDEEDGNWYHLNDNCVITSTLSRIIAEGEDY